MSDLSQRIGRELAPGLRLDAVLGAGIVGSTLAASSEAHGPVVVQLLPAEHSADLGARFLAGARAAAALDHPARVPVLADGVTESGEAFVVWPRLVAESAAELIARRPARIPPVEALRLTGELLDVLSAAHGHGILHGGLSTEDVLISDDGAVHLRGLGWAELRSELARRRGVPPTPPEFAAPERASDRTRPADEASDVWSAGAVLFALLTGQSPYDEPGSDRPARSLTELFAETPIVLARLVDSALDPEPERRLTAARMRAVAREIARLPELFLLRNLGSYQAPSPVSGPRRSPSAELETETPSTKPPSSGVRSPSHPDAVTIEFRGELPRQPVPASLARDAAQDDIPTPIPRSVADTIPAMPRAESPPPSVRRRRLADALVGEASAAEADLRVLEQLFQRLDEALRTGRSELIDQLAASTTAALAAAPGGFVWNVEPWGFSAGERALWEPDADLALIPYRLYRDGVRSLGILPGIERDEIARFVRILALSDDQVLPEDDRVTLLFSAGFAHLIHHAVDLPAADPTTRRERHRIVALATFDTSAQLEDCWQAARGGAESSPPVPTASRELDAATLTRLGEALAADVTADAAVQAALEIAPSSSAAHAGRVLEPLAERDPRAAMQRLDSLLPALQGRWPTLSPSCVARLLSASAELPPSAVTRLAELVESLDARHAEVLARALPSVRDPILAARIERQLCVGMTGHERALAQLLAGADRQLGLTLSRLLSSIDTLAAKSALERGSENPDALVRIAALGSTEGPSGERLRAELSALIAQPSVEARMAALDALERHDLRAAAPSLAVRIRSADFDKLPLDERQRCFEVLATLAPARAEAVALALLHESRLVSLPAHEETRALAADILGQVAASEEALDVLGAESRRFWRTSERVRSAAARALEQVERRSSLPPKPEEGSQS